MLVNVGCNIWNFDSTANISNRTCKGFALHYCLWILHEKFSGCMTSHLLKCSLCPSGNCHASSHFQTPLSLVIFECPRIFTRTSIKSLLIRLTVMFQYIPELNIIFLESVKIKGPKTNTWSNSTMETLEKDMKYVQM